MYIRKGWEERNSKEKRLKKIIFVKIPSLNKVEFSQNWCISKPDLGDQQQQDVLGGCATVHRFCGHMDAGSIVVATLCVECNGWALSESSDRQYQDCLKAFDFGSQQN